MQAAWTLSSQASTDGEDAGRVYWVAGEYYPGSRYIKVIGADFNSFLKSLYIDEE